MTISSPSIQPRSPANAAPSWLSDKDKDSVDASSKTLLRDLSASLTQLASAESVRRETSARVLATKYSKGILGRWAAGSGATEKMAEQTLEEAKLDTLKVVRDSVIWYLTIRLEEVGRTQQGMMERRLEREVERGRSVLYKSRPKGFDSSMETSFGMDSLNGNLPEDNARKKREVQVEKGVALEDQDRKQMEQQLSPDQLQLFAKENQDMQKQYEDTLDQVQ
ncbi:uncharacterized protein KY384_003192 [Bacidia gigantensis]|uniref:uncharacterized protein n=1 Tax=Bacidia gigantensis TaxID=2732470 RepID=UPI001D0413A7|nr:uncharacterized protein KY384_003192 [Bacidia gigantensis]KAG8531562.1 hypothetical protein KY384_003192 [Bacidia gigantensis]